MANRMTFRIWDNAGKCFVNDGEGFNVIGEFTALGGMESYIHERSQRTGDKRSTLECWNDFILMQSTGLVDSKGVEIFCGDIVKFNGIRVVTWNASGLSWMLCQDSDRDFFARGDLCLDSRIVVYEVIGNIYQHPELLEKA